jgi:uncharacterized integral membrane protein
MIDHNEYPHELVWRKIKAHDDMLIATAVAIVATIIVGFIIMQLSELLAPPIEISCGPIGYQPGVYSLNLIVIIIGFIICCGLFVVIHYTGGVVPHD